MQALFHFLISELIVECSENIKNHEEESTDNRLKEIGAEIGFKIYSQICLKRGISERPYNLAELLKNIKSKVFKHLFNYELSP
jgi:L-lysine 2,3-aminomutase